MNGWLFVGLLLFGWSSKPYRPADGPSIVADFELLLIVVASALIAGVLS